MYTTEQLEKLKGTKCLNCGHAFELHKTVLGVTKPAGDCCVIGCDCKWFEKPSAK